MSSASIEDLPPEIISMLFKYLPPMDLAACSMVNRRWYSIYATFKLHRLAAIGNVPFELGNWSYLDRRIEATERCHPAILRCSTKKLLSNLEHLLVFGSWSEFNPNWLNRFSQLVHLELYIDDFDNAKWKMNWDINLKLPKLKVLAFHCFNPGNLLIDSPLLNTLAYTGEDASQLDVKHPETIRKLATNMTGPKLAPFKDVECLITKEFKAIEMPTLLWLPRLKEIRCTLNIENLIGKWPRITVDFVKERLNEFMDEAKRLRGSDFRFNFAGFQLANVDIDEIDFGAEVDRYGRERVCKENVYMKNYHLIESDALKFVRIVNYTCLLKHATEEFPSCFFQKFTGIEEVEVHGLVKDPDHLLWFLKSLKFLKRLWLENAVLSQEFYDQLPTAASWLTRLEFRGDWRNKVHLNFDFITEFSCTSLSSLDLQQALSLESTISLVRSSADLKKLFLTVCLKENYSLYAVKKRGASSWKIFKRTETLFETENPEEIVDFLEGLRASGLD